jgi:hypothetical protein
MKTIRVSDANVLADMADMDDRKMKNVEEDTTEWHGIL